jgi:endoglucanase
MRERSIALLKELTEAHGIAGYEHSVRIIFRKHATGDILTDKLGSVYVCRKGSSDTPRVMLAGHLDEVGFMVQSITSDGYIRFVQLGRTWEPVLLSQKVRIITENEEIIGTVAAKPPHFMTEEEFVKPLKIENLYIDVGAEDMQDIMKNFNIKAGQPIVFDSDFRQLHHPDRFIAKAFDNRIGVALAIECARELLNNEHPNTVYCGANSQEEVKARGAKTAASMVHPDIAIIVEGIPADDMPGTDKCSMQGAIGQGVQIRVLDGTAIMNSRLNQLVLNIAQELKIPVQIAVRTTGGTDASQIHLNDIGVPSTVIGVPVRYSHSANGIVDIRDYLHAMKLLVVLFQRLDSKTCSQFTDY